MNVLCKCCSAEVYTIDELLENAYNTIDTSEFAQKLLNFLNVSKNEITISQNRSRKESDIENFTNLYDVIKVGDLEALLGLYFNESLTKIEGIFIKTNLFSSHPYKTFTQESAAEYLDGLLRIIDEKIEFDKYFLVLPNKNFEDDITISLHDKNRFNLDFNHMYITLKNPNFIRIMFLDNIDEDFYFESESCKSKYLYQDIIEMYPDFGMADFWVDGSSDDISVFEEFIPEDDHLVADVEDWVGDFNSNVPYSDELYENFDFDWDEFNIRGRKIYEELQFRVKDKFIVTYWKSFQEIENRRAKLNFEKKYTTPSGNDFFEDFLEKLEDIGISDEEILKFRKAHEMKNNRKIYLFSYGSMKKGFRNHYRLENDNFIGEAITVKKYNMYPAESFNYPYGIEGENKWQLHGELYELNSCNIKEIDIFEGTPDYYYRKEIEVVCNNKTYTTFIYFRTSDNPTGMDKDISLWKWTKEFEFVGVKNEEFLEALRVALLSKIDDLSVMSTLKERSEERRKTLTIQRLDLHTTFKPEDR
jgi:gamma-glutamylcyclotransferase (GGCT)/AIG2-like uncharacterized protein YtfP